MKLVHDRSELPPGELIAFDLYEELQRRIGSLPADDAWLRHVSMAATLLAANSIMCAARQHSANAGVPVVTSIDQHVERMLEQISGIRARLLADPDEGVVGCTQRDGKPFDFRAHLGKREGGR